MKARVVVTGLSLTTPLGPNLPATLGGLRQGQCGIGPINGVALADCAVQSGGELSEHSDFYRNGGGSKWLTLFFDLVAELQAGWLGPGSLMDGTLLSLGSAFLGIENDRFYPLTFFREQICDRLELGSEQLIFNSNTCASGNFAIHQGAELIRAGLAERAVCGAIDILSPYLFAGFTALRSLAGRSLPFSRSREGLVIGEGGGMLILESLESALARGAHIICEYAGFGASCDTKGVTGMDKSGLGMEAAFRRALAEGEIEPEMVDCISAHGTATKLNDQVEAGAIEGMFGKRPVVQAFKSYWGHAMGASSAIEAVLLAKALETGELYPLYNKEDFEFSINILTDKVQKNVSYALNNAFGFGGINSALLLKSYVEGGQL